MKLNLILKNLIILISIIALLNSSSFASSARKNKDFKDKYGVQLVLGDNAIKFTLN